MERSIERKNRLIEYSLYLGCVLSNLSQLPVFVKAGLTQEIALPGWAMLLIAVFLSKKIRIYRPVVKQLVLGLLFAATLLFDSIIISEIQFKSSLFYSYMISLMVFLLGTWSSEHIDERVFRNINVVFVVSVLVVITSIFFEYFGIGYSLTRRQYEYGSKNSISQMILTAIILLIVRFRPKRKIVWFIKLLVLAFALYVMLLLRSRATLVCLILCLMILAFDKQTNKNVRAAMTIAGITVIVLLIVSDKFNNFIFNKVLFAGRNTADLNDLTSGRLGDLQRFPQKISGHWLTGIGPTYYECFPLSAILQFGVFGGFVANVIAIQPLWISFKNRKMSDDWYLLLVIAAGYSVNGLFEGITPFGPGVKCYYLWLLFGFLIGRGKIAKQGTLSVVKELNSTQDPNGQMTGAIPQRY